MPDGDQGPLVVAEWVPPPVGPALRVLDQTQLPQAERYLMVRSVAEVVDAIRRLVVRGAPLLGIVGAYGVALAAARGEDVPAAARVLSTARPTAVNLARGVEVARGAWSQAVPAHRAAAALSQARRLVADDRAASRAMTARGLSLVPADARILTHCNTGALVSGGEGTALAVVLAAHRAGRVGHLWVDETRPLLQGARLTAWEAGRAGVPHSVLVDGAAGSLMARGLVDLVVVGADRVAADGSVANKVGTYPLAVLAAYHGVPVVVVAPASTFDLDCADGAGVEVEQRAPAEVTECAGRPVAPPASPAYNPAFDVTPPGLVTALVTEHDVARPVDRRSVRRAAGVAPVPDRAG
ncbi:MAG: S-methyl-5-thioribose-1-phosphate isomerase [Actinomycetes bacterium]